RTIAACGFCLSKKTFVTTRWNRAVVGGLVNCSVHRFRQSKGRVRNLQYIQFPQLLNSYSWGHFTLTYFRYY
ncbi:MAG: hypothetical protein ACLFNU_03900, partial [Bacteroidales bacterium]